MTQSATAEQAGFTRCPGDSWNDIADRDTRRVPETLRSDSYTYLGSAPLAASRYTDPAFFQLEIEKLWPNVWQYAAREEELLEAGDYVVYENAGRSYLLSRQADGSIRAFHNVCLHRGRKLRTESGWADEFQCPFHGFTWNKDGSLKNIPCRWDFGHLTDDKMQLPEAEVGRWGGYIFIRENPGGPSLEEFLDPLPLHFKEWRHEDCYTAAWAAKMVKANWKVTSEAFLEAWHSVGTHPQLLPYTADAQSKYNIYGENVSLAITAFNVSSHNYRGKPPTEQQMADAYVSHVAKRGAEAVDPNASAILTRTVGPGGSARATVADFNRERLQQANGRNFDSASDAEMQDAIIYSVFPNFGLYGGYVHNIVYRFRPGPDVDHSLMEMRVLARTPKGQPTPPAPQMKLLGPDEPWSSVPALGKLGNVLDQDTSNLAATQEGLKASKNGRVELGDYQEIKIRHMHHTLDQYLNR
jgi:phenylpropionate dioxygenase-like ring-hydroxylating dioxygenase large terminal subunit